MSDGEDRHGVAVVGLAGRFPGARDVAELWRNLCSGVESITTFSDDELLAAGVDPELLERPDYVKAKAVLDDVESFDAAFFGFTPAEAELTDPQHRLFLETCWLALEDAGCDPGRPPGAIGLFGGAGVNSYLLRNLASNPRRVASAGMLQTLIHNKNDHLCTRVGYKLGLGGPCVTVQTACSTSLVAVALACQSLADYQCDLALAGGVTVVLPARSGYLYEEGGVASPDGHCRPFDAAAAGTVDGDGVGVVVLKRLDEALADGDPIRAVVRGWAVNNDGAEKAGYTAPSLERQAEVIALAQGLAGVEPETLGFVEAHGTATPLGDPVEVAALTRAFRRRAGRDPGAARRGFCALGSIKSNLGHLDTAAGVAGLTKAVLALEHGEIPPTLHFREPNPRLELEGSPFYVNAETRPWPRGGAPRRAGVSSFGIGGTNAHLILEEAPPPEEAPAREAAATATARRWQVLTLSARTAPALEAASERLAGHLRAHPELPLADVAYTLQTGRARFDHRRAVVCRGLDDAAEALESLDPERVWGRAQGPVDRPVVFLLPGQGSQHPGMAAALYAGEAGFRRRFDLCAAGFERHLGLDLRRLLYPEVADAAATAEAAEEDGSRLLDRTLYAQPALFAVEWALAGLWMDWGVRPRALLGHSLGELTAACLAGVMGLDDALRLVAARARLLDSLPTGAMLSVALSQRELSARIAPPLELAAVNGPALCTVAGPVEAVEDLARKLDMEGVTARHLRTSHAFHSRAVEPILEALTETVSGLALSAPEVPLLSNLTGTWMTAEEAADPAYWARHLRRPVRFDAAVEALLEESDAALLEVGPGRTLKTLTRWHPRKRPTQVVETSLPHPADGLEADRALHAAVGRLWLAGVEVDWRAYHGARRRRLSLPGYPFERRRYWIAARPAGEAGPGRALEAAGPETARDVGNWLYVPTWRETPPLAGGAPRGHHLVFADRPGLGRELAERLRREGATCTVVDADEAERALRSAAACRELLGELRRRGEAPLRVVYLGNVGAAETSLGVGAWAALRERAFFSLLHLAQAWGEELPETPLALLVVSSGLVSLAGEGTLEPEKAALLGPVKVIPREYRGSACRSVDVVPPAGERERGRLAGRLLTELAEGAEAWRRRPAVALRDGRRWVQGYERLSLGAGEPATSRLRRGGCYLVTGGLGGIGLEVAGLLAERYEARLALLGRSALPERETWGAWLAERAEGDATRRKVERLRRLEAAGAEVLALAADVTDEEQVCAAVERVRSRFGRLDGVFHAAGIAGGGLIQLRSREAAASVLAPKVVGARVLEAALADETPELWVLFSSLAGVVGRPGQVAYCAANAFLDAFAHDLSRRRGVDAVAVDWCEWQGIGMAAGGLLDRGKPAAADAPFEELGRPLLDRRRRLPSGEEVYATDFDVARHWVIDDHRLVGQPVIPGVAYVEMLLEALGERARGKTVELEDLHFLAPLRVPDGDRREVRLRLAPEDGGFAFRVESDADDETPAAGAPAVREYAFGRVRLLPAKPPEHRDLEAIRAGCGEREEVFTDEQREDDLGPRWQNVRRAWIGDRQVLTHLALPEVFAGDFERMAYHPSMMDRAAGVAKEYLYDGTYLPLAYEKLRIRAPVPREIYTWARHRPEVDPTFETLTYDTLVLDSEGRVLVEFEGFSQKLVTDAGVKIKSYAGHGDWGRSLAREARAAEQPPSEGAPGRREMSAEEGVEALRRILAGPPVPQVIVSTRELETVIASAGEADEERVLEETAAPAAPARHPRPELETAYVAPAGELEERLAAAWCEVLGLERVGSRDDFFALGGDSVQAIQILAALRRAGLKLTPQEFFQRPTIAELADHLASTGAIPESDPEPAEPRPEPPPADDPYPLAELDQAGLDQLADLLEAADRREGPG